MNQTENNVYDYLLYYLSHEGTLPWEKFKDAVTRLTKNQKSHKPFTYLKSIARLGHLDYNPAKLSHVAIAPAALVETAVENRYVLVGSRTPDLINKVNKCVSETGGKMHIKLDQYAPATFVLNDLTDDSFTEIESLGFHISRAFSAKLSKRLPIPERSSFSPIEAPLQEAFNKFNINTFKFDKLNNPHLIDNGLYGVSQHGPDVHILKSGSDQRKVPRYWGVWLALSDAGKTTGLVCYDKETQIWQVKSPLQLPLILDRCATLCSGFPPKLQNNLYHYSYVPAGIAYQLTKSLHQKWEKFDV